MDWRKELDSALKSNLESRVLSTRLQGLLGNVRPFVSDRLEDAQGFLSSPWRKHDKFEINSPGRKYLVRILQGDDPIAKVTDGVRASGEFANGRSIIDLVLTQMADRIEKAEDVKYLYMAMIQASWGGKSRIADELPLFVIKVDFSKSCKIADWVFGEMEKTKDASFHFTACLMKALDDWLEGEMIVQTKMTAKSFSNMLSRWKSYQKSQQFDDLVYQYLIDRQAIPNYSHLKDVTESVNSKLEAIASSLPNSHSFREKVKVIIFYDEAHLLIDKAHKATPTLFQILRTALQFLPKQNPFVIAVFAGTHSKLANFLKDSKSSVDEDDDDDDDDDDDYIDDDVVVDDDADNNDADKHLSFEPICAITTLDVWYGPRLASIGDLSGPSTYSIYGRPALHSFFKNLKTDPLACGIMADKVLSEIESKINSGISKSILLWFRLPLSFQPTSRLVLERFPSLFTLAERITPDNSSLVLLHAPEPLIAVASRRITSRNREVFKSILQDFQALVRGGLDIDVGSIGEFLAHFLLNLSMDKVRDSRFTQSLASKMKETVDPSNLILPARLLDVIKILVGDDCFAEIEQGATKKNTSVNRPDQNVPKITEALANDVIRVISINRFDHEPHQITQSLLLEQFKRACGIAHRQGFPLIDTTFPVYRTKDLDNVMEEIPRKVGCCQFQIKNYSVHQDPCFYRGVLEAMLAALPDVSQAEYYLLVVLDHGPKGVERYTRRFILSNPNVIALAIVGLIPSHIVGHAFYDQFFVNLRPSTEKESKGDRKRRAIVSPNQCL